MDIIFVEETMELPLFLNELVKILTMYYYTIFYLNLCTCVLLLLKYCDNMVQYANVHVCEYVLAED